jgi:hypothetical protein
MNRIPSALLALGILVLAVSQGAAAPPRTVGWDDLKVKVEFEDPFEALTAEQLMELSIYARVSALKKRDAATVSETMQKEADEAAHFLKTQGVDTRNMWWSSSQAITSNCSK